MVPERLPTALFLIAKSYVRFNGSIIFAHTPLRSIANIEKEFGPPTFPVLSWEGSGKSILENLEFQSERC